MRRIIVETGNLYNHKTMTAEEIEMLNKAHQDVEDTNQQLVTKETEDMLKTSKCNCGATACEMDLNFCGICEEMICTFCGVERNDELLCVKCSSATVIMECQSCNEHIEQDQLQFCEACEKSGCDTCMLVNPETGNPICKECLNTERELLAEKEKKDQERKEKESSMFNNNQKRETMKEGMRNMKTLEDAMRYAHANNIESWRSAKGTTICQQQNTSSSVFGLCIRFNVLKSKHVYWAFRSVGEGQNTKRQWIALLCDTGRGKGIYIDLQTPEGRKQMIELTSQLVSALKKKGLWKREYNRLFVRKYDN